MSRSLCFRQCLFNYNRFTLQAAISTIFLFLALPLNAEPNKPLTGSFALPTYSIHYHLGSADERSPHTTRAAKLKLLSEVLNSIFKPHTTIDCKIFFSPDSYPYLRVDIYSEHLIQPSLMPAMGCIKKSQKFLKSTQFNIEETTKIINNLVENFKAKSDECGLDPSAYTAESVIRNLYPQQSATNALLGLTEEALRATDPLKFQDWALEALTHGYVVTSSHLWVTELNAHGVNAELATLSPPMTEILAAHSTDIALPNSPCFTPVLLYRFRPGAAVRGMPTLQMLCDRDLDIDCLSITLPGLENWQIAYSLRLPPEESERRLRQARAALILKIPKTLVRYRDFDDYFLAFPTIKD